MPPKKKAAAKKEEPKAVEKKEEPKKEEPKVAAKKDDVKADVKEEPKVKPAAKTEPAPEKKEVEKRKAEDAKAEPAKKESKTTEATVKNETAKKETKKEDDESEKEKDAPVDKRPVVKDAFSFNPSGTTLNVVPTAGGKVLMSLTEGGMQYLIAGARGNVGVKAGRYAYEVKIVEALNPAESSAGGGRGRTPAPRQLVRLGFSTASSPLVLSDTSDEHVYFDSEGGFISEKKKTSASQRFTRDQVMTVVLNMDPKSSNAYTMSLFREGVRISEPQSVPESLRDKALYPHVSFRNVTVQVLAGPAPLAALPFKCRMIQGAAEGDVEVQKEVKPKDGKYEVMVPVAFPDEGTFDWLDTFLAKNPHYVELSDRKILEWATASGLWKPKATGWKTSNDKPEFNFGLPGMDDSSVQRVLNSVTAVVPRNYIIMEVKSNLIEADRKEVLKRFSAPHFKKVAHVVMGDPSEEFKQMQLDKLLKEKQEKANVAWKAKKAEEQRKKQLEQRQKQLTEMRKKADEQRKKAAEEAKKKAEAAKKKAEVEKKKAEAAKRKKEAEEKGEEPPEEEAEEEVEEDNMDVDEGKEEEVKEEEKEDAMDEDEDQEPPEVELTEEEKTQWFKPQSQTGGSTDLSSTVLNQSFGSFSIPQKSEGFDAVNFEWQNAEASNAYLRDWVLEKKRTSRMDDLQPSQWFVDRCKEWHKTFGEWQAKQKSFKSPSALKEKAAREAKKKAAAEGDAEAEVEEEEMPLADSIDIFAVEDVADVGNGEPLFKEFLFEDWALLQLRYELYLLQIAFKKDVDDPERLGVPDAHMAFYYNKYFRKSLAPKHFGVATNTELTALVKDTVTWMENIKVLSTPLEEDLETLDMFVKLTEENRRERQRRIDAGDETARMKFSPMAIQSATTPKAAGVASATGAIRPAGAGIRPAVATAKVLARGAIYPQTGFRPPGAAGALAGGAGAWAGKKW